VGIGKRVRTERKEKKRRAATAAVAIHKKKKRYKNGGGVRREHLLLLLGTRRYKGQELSAARVDDAKCAYQNQKQKRKEGKERN